MIVGPKEPDSIEEALRGGDLGYACELSNAGERLARGYSVFEIYADAGVFRDTCALPHRAPYHLDLSLPLSVEGEELPSTNKISKISHESAFCKETVPESGQPMASIGCGSPNRLPHV